MTFFCIQIRPMSLKLIRPEEHLLTSMVLMFLNKEKENFLVWACGATLCIDIII